MGLRAGSPGRLGLLILAALAAAACGRRGEPAPPATAAAPPPRAGSLVRMGDHVAARMAEPVSTLVGEWVAAPEFHCTENLDGIATSVPLAASPWSPWARFPAPTTGAGFARLRSHDGGRTGPWQPIPPAALVPAPPALTTSVDRFGRAALWPRGTTDLVVEAARLSASGSGTAPSWRLYGPQQTTVVRFGPYPPGSRHGFRLFGRAATGGATALSARPATAMVVIPDG